MELTANKQLESNMKLTKEQITSIKEFIAQKGFKYLDVQMEILDHVASVVEEKMTADTALSFDNALKQTHASFGVFGFSTVEDSIMNAMGKKYSKVFWSSFLSFFNFKYIFLVLLSGVLLYLTQSAFKGEFYFSAFWLIAFVTFLGILVVAVLRFKGYKNLLVYRTSLVYLMFIGTFLQIFNFLLNRTSDALIVGLNLDYVITCILLVFFIIYVISAIRTAMLGIKESELLMEKYSLIDN